MNDRMTTAFAGIFRAEDVTNHNARRQKEIVKELAQEGYDTTDKSSSVMVPVSLTPEQVKRFYTAKADDTTNTNERRVYEQTVKWIDEMLDLKKKVVALEAKQTPDTTEDTSAEDITETSTTST